MFLLLASLMTLAAAAPRVLPNTHFTESSMRQYSNIYPNQELFGVTMNQFNVHFDSAPWEVVVEDPQYVLSMPMPGYMKEDIEVLAQRGMLIMRAIHKEEDIIIKSQIVFTVLPLRVNPAGRWTYDGVLRITFPIGDAGINAVARDDDSSDVIPITYRRQR